MGWLICLGLGGQGIYASYNVFLNQTNDKVRNTMVLKQSKKPESIGVHAYSHKAVILDILLLSRFEFGEHDMRSFQQK